MEDLGSVPGRQQGGAGQHLHLSGFPALWREDTLWGVEAETADFIQEVSHQAAGDRRLAQTKPESAQRS
jgi:hypothetical protein